MIAIPHKETRAILLEVGADSLAGADLQRAVLLAADLRGADLPGRDGCKWVATGRSGIPTTAEAISARSFRTGEVREWRSPGGDAGPYGIAIGSDGRIWYCESHTGSMVAFDPKTEKMEVVAIPTPGAVVRHVQTDSTRSRIWLALSGTGRLGKIEVGGGAPPE
jgi:streptogramin lyase